MPLSLPERLLTDAEAREAVRLIGSESRGPYLLVCDHASHRIPAVLGDLGLPRERLVSHIGWDIGAREVTERLAERLHTRAVAAGFSRLVADCNRYPWDPGFIAARVDGIDVPGNREVGAIERQRRLEEVFLPYQAQARLLFDEVARAHRRPILISVHSMTPALRSDGRQRPWEISLCWAESNPLVEPLLANLGRRGVRAGNNQPYALDIGIDFTTCELALRRGLPYLQVEFRQDLIATRLEAHRHADVLVDALLEVEAGYPELLDGGWPILSLRAHHGGLNA